MSQDLVHHTKSQFSKKFIIFRSFLQTSMFIKLTIFDILLGTLPNGVDKTFATGRE